MTNKGIREDESTALLSARAEQPVEADEGAAAGWPRAAARSVDAAPWWIISAVAHAILLFLSMLIVVVAREEPEACIEIVEAALAPPPPPKRDRPVEPAERRRARVNLTARAEQPFYTPEKLEVTEREIETENEEVNAQYPARGQQEAVSTIPAGGRGAIGFFGVGGGGRAGAFGWRTGGGRRRRAMRFGGSAESEAAVDLGLEWLKEHQEADGRWDRARYMESRGYGRGSRYDVEGDNTGVTGLALLAFLGAGHTERHGRYRPQVQAAVGWLVRGQKRSGLWGANGWEGGFAHDGNAYRNAIGAMAVSEAAGMARVPATVCAAQRAVNGLCASQQPYGAWNYGDFRRGQTHINDTSITIWAAMALKSAKVSGLRVPGQSFAGPLNWIEHAQNLSGARAGDYAWRGGRVGYRGTMDGAVSPRNSAVRIPNLLTAAGGVIRVFWGQKPDHPGVAGPCSILLAESLPGAGREPSYYEWYYATLLMFQKGGEHWRRWNRALQPALLAAQRRGDPKKLGGSWNPDGDIVDRGGRVFSTALCVLTLEVYYRYLPMYGR